MTGVLWTCPRCRVGNNHCSWRTCEKCGYDRQRLEDAAPELLAACQAVLRWFDLETAAENYLGSPVHETRNGLATQLQEAIARTGEATPCLSD